MDEPTRGVLLQHRDQTRPVRAPAKSPQGFEQGQIGFPRPMLLNALPTAEPPGSVATTCATHASTRVVLPIPASPVTRTIWRWPWLGLRPSTAGARPTPPPAHHERRRPAARPRLLGCPRRRSGHGRPPSPGPQSDTHARVPSPHTAASAPCRPAPGAARECTPPGPRHSRRAASHTAAKRSSLLTNWPACATR